MSPRQARRERREAERKAKKLELKKSRLAENDPLAAVSEPRLPRSGPFPDVVQQNNPEPDLNGGFVSQTASAVSAKRAATNRANARHSTGPRSVNGKMASSRNSTKHGLASGTLVIPGEDPAALAALENDLLEEHQPATPTEELLILEMAHSHWLSQRALRLQNDCFTEQGVDQKGLALYLRYGTTHHRAFHKALADLQRLQKERRKLDRGFVSQKRTTTTKPQRLAESKKDEPSVFSEAKTDDKAPQSGSGQNEPEPVASGFTGRFVSQNATASAPQAAGQTEKEAA